MGKEGDLASKTPEEIKTEQRMITTGTLLLFCAGASSIYPELIPLSLLLSVKFIKDCRDADLSVNISEFFGRKAGPGMIRRLRTRFG